jgi:hypothetical protein
VAGHFYPRFASDHGRAQFVWIPSLAFLLLGLPAGANADPNQPAGTDGDRIHWSFRKVIRREPPEVQEKTWVANPIDAFILSRLEQAGLRPTPPADRITLLRRVTFDLTGLPPPPEEEERFLHDNNPDAYPVLVERLLGSPQYGERWAQHWLDLARFAESNGYEIDADRPHAWRYRDYVIRSLNDNKPFNRFVTEQIAGDLLPRDADSIRQADRLIATGFNRCGPIHLVSGNVDKDEVRYELLSEMNGAIGSAFLGLTLACARCHDHKFDPVSQADYFRLQAFFAATQPCEIDLATTEEKATYTKRMNELKKAIEPLQGQIRELEAPYQNRLTEKKNAALERRFVEALAVDAKLRTPPQKELAAHAEILLKVSWDELVEALSPADRARRAELRAKVHTLELQAPPPPPEAWAVKEVSPIPPTHILKRGNLAQKKDRVEPAFPGILNLKQSGATAVKPESREAGPGDSPPARLTRVDLADWLTAPENPLTARVIVNRLWQHHFGRGLAATPNDFGKRGAAPTHPELLDWLASELVEKGWSLKHIHRLMVLSNTYRQGSRLRSDARARTLDPDNQLLSRMNRRRRDGEGLRDCVLAVTGTLNPRIGGPSVRIPLEPEVYDLIFTEGEPDNLWPVTPDANEHNRRSLYLMAKRNVRLPLFEAFDQPDRLTSCPVRPVSTYAPQALILLNGPFLQKESQVLAVRLLRECGPDADRQIERAYQLGLARHPTVAEKATVREFLAGQSDLLRDRLRARLRIPLVNNTPDGIDPADAAALADFCLALFNCNEFLYVD